MSISEVVKIEKQFLLRSHIAGVLARGNLRKRPTEDIDLEVEFGGECSFRQFGSVILNC